VGVQTSQGEGWGLTTHEGFAVGRPQIVPNHSACAELWSDFTSLVHVGDPIVDRQSGITQYPPLIGAIAQNMAIEYAELRQRYSRQSLRNNAIKPEYQWDNIADQFLNLINESL
jgi:glycosyltransferase involved in cell wall biosynthesis